MRGPENIAVGQGAKFGTFAVSRIVNLRWQRMDQRTQNFHFPVFHDSGDTDQYVDRKVSEAELWLSCCFSSTATSGKLENRKCGHHLGRLGRRLSDFAFVY